MGNINAQVVESMGKDGKRLKVGGIWYSAFNASALSGCEMGDTVSFEFVEKGQWKNIKGNVTINSKGAGGSTKIPGVEVLPKVGAVILDRDRTIARQNALTNAREVAIAWSKYSEDYYSNVDEMMRDIIKIAYAFEEYTTGDIEKNNAKKALEGLEKDFSIER